MVFIFLMKYFITLPQKLAKCVENMMCELTKLRVLLGYTWFLELSCKQLIVDGQVLFHQAVCSTASSKNVLNVKNEQIWYKTQFQFLLIMPLTRNCWRVLEGSAREDALVSLLAPRNS